MNQPFPNALSVLLSSIHRARKTMAGNKDLNSMQVKRLKREFSSPRALYGSFSEAFGLTKPPLCLNTYVSGAEKWTIWFFENFVSFQGEIIIVYFKSGWRETCMNSCFIADPFKMQMIVPKITKVYTPDVLIIHYSFFFFFGYTYSLLHISEFILPHNPSYENSYLFLNNFVFYKELKSKNNSHFPK